MSCTLCRWLALAKQVACKAGTVQMVTAWQLRTWGTAQAGNRAGKTRHYLQWWESKPEQDVETSGLQNLDDCIFFWCLESPAPPPPTSPIANTHPPALWLARHQRGMSVKLRDIAKGTWCSGITSASHAEGPGFKSQCVQFGVVSQHSVGHTWSASHVLGCSLGCLRARRPSPLPPFLLCLCVGRHTLTITSPPSSVGRAQGP
jgi:hypothetical protein